MNLCLLFFQVTLFLIWGFTCCKVKPCLFTFIIMISHGYHWMSLAKTPTYFKPSIHFFLLLHQVGWDSVMRMDANLRDLFLYEAFLYYNPLLLTVSWGVNSTVYVILWTQLLWNFSWWFLLFLLQTMMVWLWGVNLWTFLQSTVSYAKVFDLDQNHLTHREIWKVVKFFASFLRKHYSC